MPKIINAYSDASGSIADSLKSLGESMFGNGAQHEVHRQTATHKKRENDNIPLLADAVRRGDRGALGYYGVMSNKTGADTANFNLLSTTNNARSVDDPRVNLAQIGAHMPISATATGQGRELANRQTIQKIASDRAAATQLSIDARTLTPMRDPSGAIQMVPKSEVANYRTQGWMAAETPDTAANNRTSVATNAATNTQSGANNTATNETSVATNAATNATSRANNQDTVAGANYRHDSTPHTVYDNVNGVPVPTTATNATAPGRGAAPLSVDQVKGGIIQNAVNPQGDGTVPLGQSSNDTTMPAGYLHPLVQETLGYGKGAVPYQHTSGAVGQSYDGGATIDGHPAGPGWVPVTSQEALTQNRTNSQIQSASQPLPAPGTGYPQAAQDAASTSGVKSVVQQSVNNTVGFLGGPEVGANTNRARENLTNLANEARSVLLSSPGRQAVQAQKWANASIPQPGALGMTGANADQQRNAVISLTQQMRQVYAAEAAEAQDRNTNPADRAKLLTHMAQLKRIIEAYEAPAQQQGGAPPAAAPQAAPGGVLKYDAQGNRVQ